ncbi:MAG TPA: hypothetical protein PLP66_05285 [Phycisphaerae bacterium]|nr:hypothetical protein [Phycisphaerae bacterium]HQL53566.1 hypothetical protein [Phycisphaerae bacterium]
MRIWLDKIASATSNVPLRREVRVSPEIIAREGYIVAGQVRGEKSTYNQLEDIHGRMVTLHDGDVIAGVLGQRNALHGYSGHVPASVAVGDVLQVLNLGGVIGKCTSENPDVGRAFDLEVLGSVLVFPEFESRAGVPAHIGMNAITADGLARPTVPVVYVAGTCMNSGKTAAACQVIRQLAKRGLAVGACKLTGVSLRRDVLQMRDYGARWAVSFTDAGSVSTSAGSAVSVARTLITHLAHTDAAVIVAELGDGVLGEYGVAEILADAELKSLAAVVVLCATDPVGAWGAQRLLRERFDLAIDVIAGPTTDNAVGTRFVQEQLGLQAINARTHGRELGALVAARLAERAPQVVA